MEDFNKGQIQCIKVPKVYDWVSRQIDVPVISILDLSNFTGDPCHKGEEWVVECFLSDQEGNKIDPLEEGSILCVEIPQEGERKKVTKKLNNGETVTLQKVKVLNKGFIVVKVKNANRTWVSQPIEWNLVEKYILCAPPGTVIQCHITDFECDAIMICNSDDTIQQIDVFINLCQDIQTELLVKIGIEGKQVQVVKKVVKKVVIEEEEEEE